MYFLLSGEGPTDLGAGTTAASICEGRAFSAGPLAVMVEQIAAGRCAYACGYVSEHHLVSRANELKAAKKKLRLPGKRQRKETRYFYNNARILARIAKEKQAEVNDPVVAVLFRDCDGAASAGRGLWTDKRQSMLDGFDEEGFKRGVPMIPKPKSEAWLLCALKKNPYQDCAGLEGRSGSDKSPKSLKKELEVILGGRVTAGLLCMKVLTRAVDVDQIDMPSFRAFRERLEEAAGLDGRRRVAAE